MKKLNNELDQESPDQPIRYVDVDEFLTQAAIEECNRCNKVLKEEPLTSDIEWNEPDFSVGYKHGVKSDIAKEYWQEQFMQNNETYTENEVFNLLIKSANVYVNYIKALIMREPAEKPNIIKWFEEHKK